MKTYLITVSWTRTTFSPDKVMHHHVPSTFILKNIHPAVWFNRVNSGHDKEEKHEDYVTYEAMTFFAEIPSAYGYEHLQDLSRAKAGDN